MYSLVSQLSIRKLLLEQLPILGGSLLLAELFYKFHSFTLECLAFLATWYVLDVSVLALRRAWKGKQNISTQGIRS